MSLINYIGRTIWKVQPTFPTHSSSSKEILVIPVSRPVIQAFNL